MNQIRVPLSYLLLLLLLLPGCVAKRKYLAAQSQISSLRGDSLSLSSRIQRMEDQLRQLDEANRNTNRQLQNTASELENRESQLNMSQEQIAAQQRRLQQLQGLIEQQRRNTEQLRRRIAEALGSFSANELTVTMRNGRVYVSMQESLLFPSGSAAVNPRGKEALSALASALNKNPDINVLVEGHTDSIPISRRYEDNWALSTARSTAIARILIKDYQVNPARITASGRAWHDPVATNSTENGRALNRRTEIILEPKLDALMELIRGQ
jgi:chemotaxis protein MotB